MSVIFLIVAAYVGAWSRGLEASLLVSFNGLRRLFNAPRMSISLLCMYFENVAQGERRSTNEAHPRGEFRGGGVYLVGGGYTALPRIYLALL